MTRRRFRKPREKLGDRRHHLQVDAAFLRRCCSSRIDEAHLAGCVRPLGRCGNKVGHSTRERAQAFIVDLAPTLGRMTPYRCAGCGAWHIGHPKTVDEGLEA